MEKSIRENWFFPFFSGSARAYARACHGDSKPSPLPSLTLNNIQIFLNKKGEVRV